MSAPEREQRLVFGEVAEQFDAYRPTYPDALFDTIIEFGALHAGDHTLEIGAGPGKATMGFVARGLEVHALEPSAPMAQILRARGVEVESTLFESWEPSAGVIAECAALEPRVMRTATWNRSYSRAEWVQMLGTHSDHRILPDEQRARLHRAIGDAIGDAIDRHGGRVDKVYDVECYLSRRV